MVRAIFKGLVIAAAGPMGGQFTEDNLARWTAQRQGKFSKTLDDSVTHLLCTTEQYKGRNKNPRLLEGISRGKSPNIVHIDWYESSCFKNRKQRERDYNFQAIRGKEIALRKQQREEELAQKNSALGETWFNPDLYRLFIDHTHFEYQVELFRTFQDEFGICLEKYILHLFESRAKPRLYWFAVKFFKKTDNKPWRLAGIDRPGICPGLFKPEFRKFKEFFRLKTTIEWRDRILRAGTTAKTAFQYTPPSRGKPVGGLPRDLTTEECFARNSELHQDLKELFGEDIELEAEDAMASNMLDTVRPRHTNSPRGLIAAAKNGDAADRDTGRLISKRNQGLMDLIGVEDTESEPSTDFVGKGPEQVDEPHPDNEPEGLRASPLSDSRKNFLRIVAASRALDGRGSVDKNDVEGIIRAAMNKNFDPFTEEELVKDYGMKSTETAQFKKAADNVHKIAELDNDRLAGTFASEALPPWATMTTVDPADVALMGGVTNNLGNINIPEKSDEMLLNMAINNAIHENLKKDREAKAEADAKNFQGLSGGPLLTPTDPFMGGDPGQGGQGHAGDGSYVAQLVSEAEPEQNPLFQG